MEADDDEGDWSSFAAAARGDDCGGARRGGGRGADGASPKAGRIEKPVPCGGSRRGWPGMAMACMAEDGWAESVGSGDGPSVVLASLLGVSRRDGCGRDGLSGLGQGGGAGSMLARLNDIDTIKRPLRTAPALNLSPMPLQKTPSLDGTFLCLPPSQPRPLEGVFFVYRENPRWSTRFTSPPQMGQRVTIARARWSKMGHQS